MEGLDPQKQGVLVHVQLGRGPDDIPAVAEQGPPDMVPFELLQGRRQGGLDLQARAGLVLARLDEKLFLDVFAQSPKPKAAGAAPRKR